MGIPSQIRQWHRYICLDIKRMCGTTVNFVGRRADIGLLHGVTNLRIATKDQEMAGVRFGKPDLPSPVWHEATVKVTCS
jgi:hypothetical protein